MPPAEAYSKNILSVSLRSPLEGKRRFLMLFLWHAAERPPECTCARKSTLSKRVCAPVCVCARRPLVACLLVLHSHLVCGQCSDPLEGTWPAACSPGSAGPCQAPHLAWPPFRERGNRLRCAAKRRPKLQPGIIPPCMKRSLQSFSSVFYF